jgi:hypothetical protein
MSTEPTITHDEETGRYSIVLAPGCLLLFWIESRDGSDHHFLRLLLPPGTPVHEVDNGADFVRPTQH